MTSHPADASAPPPSTPTPAEVSSTRPHHTGPLVGLVGLVLLFLPGTGVQVMPVVGGALAISATLCWCAGSFATRWLPMPANPFVASVYEMLAGAAAMTLLAVAHHEPAPWTVPGI